MHTNYVVEVQFAGDWLYVAAFESPTVAADRQQFNEYQLGVSSRVRKWTANLAFGAIRR